jgi:acyl dehydratase
MSRAFPKRRWRSASPRAKGFFGTNRDYLYRTVRRLRELGIADGPMHRLERRVRVLANEPATTTEGNLNMKTISFEELPTLVGQEIGVSDWQTIDQDRINKFAEATGDHQWIHVDVERAKKEMPGGKTIAHGYLTLSLVPMMGAGILRVTGVSRGINYGCNKVRFTNMVTVGQPGARSAEAPVDRCALRAACR